MDKPLYLLENKKGNLFYICVFILVLSPLYIDTIWYNPPIFMTCVYAVSIFIVVASIGGEWNSFLSRVVKLLGRYSVHIFMYHMLIKQFFPLWSKHVTFIVILFSPIAIGYCIDRALEKGKACR